MTQGDKNPLYFILRSKRDVSRLQILAEITEHQPAVRQQEIADMQDDQWAVAFAYNYTRKPGLHGHENPLEVRYYCTVQESDSVRMFRSDTADEKSIDAEALSDGDAFIRFALTQERNLVVRAA